MGQISVEIYERAGSVLSGIQHDEVLFVGDQRFQRKCHYELLERRKDRAMIIAIHSPEFVREQCTSALVLKAGRGRVFEDVGLAADIYSTL